MRTKYRPSCLLKKLGLRHIHTQQVQLYPWNNNRQIIHVFVYIIRVVRLNAQRTRNVKTNYIIYYTYKNIND